LSEDGVVTDDFSQFREMPRVPLFDSHSECVDIFIQQFKQIYGLDNRFILSVDIQGYFAAGEGVGKTQASLI
jgi:hypothetical protein